MAVKMRTSRKLAIFFTSVPREKAIGIMKYFSPKTMEVLTAEIRSLGSVEKEVKDEVYQEIADKLVSGIDPTGGENAAKEILVGAIGESEALKMLERAQPRKPKPFSTIQHVAGQDLATILSDEQPSTSAIILSFFTPKKTADVLSFLDEEKREDVVMRLAQNSETDNEIIERIEEVFVNKVTSSLSTSEEEEKSMLGGPELVAEIFQSIDKETEDNLMEAVQNESADLADKIRDLMFTFDDIVKLTDADIQKILREAPMEKLILALRGASEELFEKFAGNLSKRARENMMEEIEMMGKIKKSEIEAERKGIVGIIRGLEAGGEIELSSGDDGDVYV